ncbi:MAG: hypothetical protein QCI38_07435 [Candidatus Thermoplasmatota archaeon]|nr:hypothetical protein [Candidatus Thermoplasmatota archaeon]
MADDRRFMTGWGLAVIFFSTCALIGIMGIMPWLAAAGLFFVLMGIGMAALSNMGEREPLLTGGGMGFLALGAIMTIVAYQLAEGIVVLLLILIIAGVGLVLMGIKGGK